MVVDSKPERYTVMVAGRHYTRIPVSLETARDVAKAISTIDFKQIDVTDSQGQVAESYKRGSRLAVERRGPPMGKQFYTPPETRPARDIREELLNAAKAGDVSAVAKLTQELAES